MFSSKAKQEEFENVEYGTLTRSGLRFSSHNPSLKPCPHHILGRWKSSSGDDPMGEESAHPDSVRIAETIAMEAHRMRKLAFADLLMPSPISKPFLWLGLFPTYLSLHLEPVAIFRNSTVCTNSGHSPLNCGNSPLSSASANEDASESLGLMTKVFLSHLDAKGMARSSSSGFIPCSAPGLNGSLQR